jgi:hypothetical protein
MGGSALQHARGHGGLSPTISRYQQHGVEWMMHSARHCDWPTACVPTAPARSESPGEVLDQRTGLLAGDCPVTAMPIRIDCLARPTTRTREPVRYGTSLCRRSCSGGAPTGPLVGEQTRVRLSRSRMVSPMRAQCRPAGSLPPLGPYPLERRKVCRAAVRICRRFRQACAPSTAIMIDKA